MTGSSDSEDVDVAALVEEARRRTWERAEAALEAGDAERAMAWLGNEDRHAALFEWWSGGSLDLDELRAAILFAWSHGPRHHSRDVTVEEWLGMFREAGFVSDPPQPPPTEPLEVWRGQPAQAEPSMSWSTDRAQAEWFRDRWIGRGIPAVLLSAVAPPSAVLAMDNGRGENEVIVDPGLLSGVRRHDA